MLYTVKCIQFYTIAVFDLNLLFVENSFENEIVLIKSFSKINEITLMQLKHFHIYKK